MKARYRRLSAPHVFRDPMLRLPATVTHLGLKGAWCVSNDPCPRRLQQRRQALRGDMTAARERTLGSHGCETSRNDFAPYGHRQAAAALSAPRRLNALPYHFASAVSLSKG